MQPYRSLLRTAPVAALLLAGGCGDSTEVDADVSADASADVGSGDTAPDAEGSDTGGNDGSLFSREQVTFRITRVAISRPSGVGTVLQNLINKDIGEGALHVLIQAFEFGGEPPTTLRVRGNAGTTVEGGYTWYPGVALDDAAGTIDTDLFFTNCPDGVDPTTCETLDIIFPALEPGKTEPLQIPVSNLGLNGNLFETEDGWALEGTLSGALLKTQIQDIQVELAEGQGQPLMQLLGGDARMDYPVGAAEGERTGWRLEAEIQAVEVPFVPRVE